MLDNILGKSQMHRFWLMGRSWGLVGISRLLNARWTACSPRVFDVGASPLWNNTLRFLNVELKFENTFSPEEGF